MSKKKGSPSNKYGPKKQPKPSKPSNKRAWDPVQVRELDQMLLNIIDQFEIDEKSGIRDEGTEKRENYELIARFTLPLFKMARLAIQTELELIELDKFPGYLTYAQAWHEMISPIIDRIIIYAEQREALEAKK